MHFIKLKMSACAELPQTIRVNSYFLQGLGQLAHTVVTFDVQHLVCSRKALPVSNR